MNLVKYRDIIERKESEMEALRIEIMSIRENIIDDDYSEFERKHKEYFSNRLPEKIIYKIRPISERMTKLRIECNCIEDMILDYFG